MFSQEKLVIDQQNGLMEIVTNFDNSVIQDSQTNQCNSFDSSLLLLYAQGFLIRKHK